MAGGQALEKTIAVLFGGDIWYLDDKTNQQIILHYDKDGAVENVRLGERFNSIAADMWRSFYTKGTTGNSQEVYLDGNGLTALIIYGE